MSSSFVDYLFDPMDKSVGDMVAGFIKGIAKMIANALMLSVVKQGMAAMGFTGLFAKGGVFDGGLQPFANGGVVDRPTPFKFASGGSFKNGVMGEAGPEAIMPLKKGSDGKLGVTLNGGGGAGEVSINIVINSDGGESTSGDSDAKWNQIGQQIASTCRGILVTEQRPGGLLYR
jgi:lambda family phage tail tape measure protein